jgi:hypothetical protein
MTIETHWWGVEVTFSKDEKEKLVAVVDISGAAVGTGALLEALKLIAVEVAGASGPLLAVIAAILAILAGELAACNLIGKGGFRICITWLVITLPPPLGTLTLQPLPNF